MLLYIVHASINAGFLLHHRPQLLTIHLYLVQLIEDASLQILAENAVRFQHGNELFLLLLQLREGLRC